jgi:S-adenosylmethionine:tRNA ribosyltransferase-isomerase
MHPEEVKVSIALLQSMVKHEGPLIAVGTTSVRSLESLYWLALNCLETGIFPEKLESAEPYLWAEKAKPYREVFGRLLIWMQQQNQTELSFQTKLYLMPGYDFRVITGMVTNFHQPGSTLVVLVAAFLGDAWRKVYEEALARNYRFLSYGDSSLLIRN